MWWLQSRRWRMSCRPVVACPWRISRSQSCGRKRWQAESSRRSAAQRCGAGLVRTHCVLGGIAVGSSRATRSLPPRRVGSGAAGKVQSWGRAITYSASMRRPASRQGGGNTGHCRRHQGVRSISSMNTHGQALWPISPHGMCIGPDNFYKNISIIGGFLLLYVTGGGKYSVDARLGSAAPMPC
jgi:hypothetical protein